MMVFHPCAKLRRRLLMICAPSNLLAIVIKSVLATLSDAGFVAGTLRPSLAPRWCTYRLIARASGGPLARNNSRQHRSSTFLRLSYRGLPSPLQ